MSSTIALPPPTSAPRVVIEPSGRWQALELGEVWRFRELLLFFAWRDIKVRYRQTVLGAAWAVLQPVLTMVIFSIIFGTLAKLPSGNIPYPVFTYTALLPWQLFAFALSSTSNSLVSNQNLISKVYFPRLIAPCASIIVGLVDFAIAFVVLLGLMLFYGLSPGAAVVALPLLLILTIATALAVGLWLSALNVQYRDVRYAVPFLTQFWMWATPVAYSTTLIPEKWRWLYSLNPMTGVVEGFRWVMLGNAALDWPFLLLSVLIVLLLLVSGLLYFKRMEASFADVI